MANGPKYLPGLEGDSEGAILENWTRSDWSQWFAAEVKTTDRWTSNFEVRDGRDIVTNLDAIARNVETGEIDPELRSVVATIESTSGLKAGGRFPERLFFDAKLEDMFSRMSPENRIAFFQGWSRLTVDSDGTPTVSRKPLLIGLGGLGLVLLVAALWLALRGPDPADVATGPAVTVTIAPPSEPATGSVIEDTTPQETANVEDTDESTTDTAAALNTIPETTPSDVAYSHADQRVDITLGGDAQAFANDPDTSYYNVLITISTPDGAYTVNTLTNAGGTTCEVAGANTRPIDGATCSVGWASSNEWFIDFLNPDDTSQATAIEYAILSGVVVDGEDVYYQHNGSASP